MSSPGRQPLRVTIVAGLSQAGRAAVVERLLQEPHAGRTAMPSHEGRGVAQRSTAERGSGAHGRQLAFAPALDARSAPQQIVAGEVRRLAAAGAVDSLIVELPAGAELTAVIAAFARGGGERGELAELAELDAVVVVIDGRQFFDDYTGTDTLAARGLALNTDDRRHVSQLLAEQIEAADILVVSRADHISRGELALLEDTLCYMNGAAILQRQRCCGPAARGYGGAGRRPSLNERSRSGVSSFVYRARRPFHPERLRELLQREWSGVLRSRGVFWLATRMSEVGWWSQAGAVWEVTRAGHWWASLPAGTWAGSSRLAAEIQRHWQEPFGDRRQELRFVGWDMDQPSLQARFDGCLLTDAELALGPAGWAQLCDPFASWSGLIPSYPRGSAHAALG